MPEEASKEAMIEEAYKTAYEYVKKYTGCAQCVLAPIQKIFGLQSGGAFKGATGLSGGIGAMRSACGALTGGVIALGLKEGRANFEDISREENVANLRKYYGLAKKLYKKFEEEYGSCNCRDIQEKVLGRSYDLWDDTQLEEFMKVAVEKCPEVVGKAARWVAEMLLEE